MDALTAQELELLSSKSDSDKIAHLRNCAKQIAADRLDNSEAIALLRGRAGDIGAPVQNPELKTFLLEARRGKVSALDLVRPGQRLSSRSAPFLWEGIVLPNVSNLVIGREKKGKTSLLIAWIAAWHFGCDTFINQPLHGTPPPVFIIGPDMPEEDWHTLLRLYHLLDEDGTLLTDGPIKGLLHKGHQIRLNRDGIDLIESIAAEHPGALFLFDSYATLVSGLGLREEGAEFADPCYALQAALAPHHATLLIIHHSAANRDTGKATSRGSTALPAAVTQQVFLESPTNDADDSRIQVRTKGRARDFKALLRKEEPDGHWVCISQGSALVEQQAHERTISKLKGLQRQIFDALLALRQEHPGGCDYWEIAHHLNWSADPASVDRVRRPVEALCGRGLIMEMPLKSTPGHGTGRPRLRYRVRQAVADLCRRGISGLSELSHQPADAPETQNHDPLCVNSPKRPESPEILQRNGSAPVKTPVFTTGEHSDSPDIPEKRFLEYLDSPHRQALTSNGHAPPP